MSENSSEIRLNAYLSEAYKIAPRIFVRIAYIWDENEVEPKVKMVLEIYPKIKTHVNNAWDEIEKYRKLLLGIFGSDLNENYDIVLYELDQLKQKGFSWAKLAQFVNYQTLAFLYSAYDDEKNNILGMGKAGLLFYYIALRKSIKDCEEDMEWGFEEINMGKVPWSIKSGPFTPTKIRSTINAYNDRIKEHRLFIVSQTQEKASLWIEVKLLLDKGYYEKINSLLKKSYPEEWDKTKRVIFDILKTISPKGEKNEKLSKDMN